MLKLPVFLRILRFMALAVVLSAFGVSVLAWFRFHTGLGRPELSDLANLCGLLFGTALTFLLIWTTSRSASFGFSATVILRIMWLGVFAWYWFNRFAVREFHSLDPGRILREQAQQTAISIGFFFLWAALCLVGPTMTARRPRH